MPLCLPGAAPSTVRIQRTEMLQARGSPATDLAALIVPGDVLLCRGTGRIMAIGANGGLTGHVMLATHRPTWIAAKSAEAARYQAVWPSGVSRLLKVFVAESTRDQPGLHLGAVFLQESEGKLLIVAEENQLRHTPELVCMERPEVMEVFTCPAEHRGSFQPEIFEAVLHGLYCALGDWSKLTAARAVLRPAVVVEMDEDVLADLVGCWSAAPICTTVIIQCWQRYLLAYAKASGQSAVRLIGACMPLKSDRALPGELESVMKSCGWTQLC